MPIGVDTKHGHLVLSLNHVAGMMGFVIVPLWVGGILIRYLVGVLLANVFSSRRIWRGDVSPRIPVLTSPIRRDMRGDAARSGMHRRCKTEMAIPASFLPDLYPQERAAQEECPCS